MTPTAALANRVRVHVLQMVYAASASHVGSSLSCTDILATLYHDIMRVRPEDPAWPDRDRFILSKGHAAASLYAVLAETGFFPLVQLEEFCQDGSSLMGHASHHVPGVEFSTGSLGHGLSVGCGLALAALRDHRPQRVFVLLSDGELGEGSNWEAILFAGMHRLCNLTAIVDRNNLQGFGRVADVLDLNPLQEKWRACGWDVRECDGHSPEQLKQAFGSRADRPLAVIADTVKGKGVSFMEDSLAWHYKSPNAAQLAQAIAEVKPD